MSQIESVPPKNFTDAETDRTTYQNVIETAGQGAAIVARTQNLERYTAFMLPVAREAEYNAATTADKLRFVLVAQRTFQRESNGETDFLTIFEDEYSKEFV